MRIHHLNCATLCPRGERLISGTGGLLAPGRLVCHCLAVETTDGILLVDTGLGEADIARPERVGRAFRLFVRPTLAPAESMKSQLIRLGYSTTYVRHIVLTHLDVDHAGGLADFPAAKVHLWAAEKEAADSPAIYGRRSGYRPAQWAHGVAWVAHEDAHERWSNLPAVRILPGMSPEVWLVPLPGHTRGHSAVAVRDGDGWLLHCGDAYYFRGELETPPRCPAGLRLTARTSTYDEAARMASLATLRDLARDPLGTLRLFCAHDPVELERFAEGV